MARVFTKLGKEITIAAKQGGTEPENNPRLRVLMQTAKKENMPKENVERAIKRAVSKLQGDELRGIWSLRYRYFRGDCH